MRLWRGGGQEGLKQDTSLAGSRRESDGATEQWQNIHSHAKTPAPFPGISCGKDQVGGDRKGLALRYRPFYSQSPA